MRELEGVTFDFDSTRYQFTDVKYDVYKTNSIVAPLEMAVSCTRNIYKVQQDRKSFKNAAIIKLSLKLRCEENEHGPSWHVHSGTSQFETVESIEKGFLSEPKTIENDRAAFPLVEFLNDTNGLRKLSAPDTPSIEAVPETGLKLPSIEP